MSSFSGPEGVYSHLHFQPTFAPLSYLSTIGPNSTQSVNASTTSTSASNNSSSAGLSSSTPNTSTSSAYLSTSPSNLPISSASNSNSSGANGFGYNPNSLSTSTGNSNSSTSQQQQPLIPQFPPKLSTVSTRITSNINTVSKKKESNYKSSNLSSSQTLAAANSAAGLSGSDDKDSSEVGSNLGTGTGGTNTGTGSDASLSGDDNARPGGVPGRGTKNRGPILESPLAAQGIDAFSFSLTGGVGGIQATSLLASRFGSASGLFPSCNSNVTSGLVGSIANTPSGLGLVGGPSTENQSNSTMEKKLSRPKNSLKSTSSSFIQRVQFNPELTKILSFRTSLSSSYFLSIGKSFIWLNDLQSTRDPLARITFSSAPTCHDVNQLTRSSTSLDVLIGFASGDVFWLDPILGKYSRINKNGSVTKSPVTQIRWLPNEEGLFMTSHQDGCCTVYDREREEAKEGSWKLKGWEISNPSTTTKNTIAKEEEGMEILDSDFKSSNSDRPSAPQRFPTSETVETSSEISSSRGEGSRRSSLIDSSAPNQTPITTDSSRSGSGSKDSPPGAWNPRNSIIVTHPGQTHSTALTPNVSTPGNANMGMSSPLSRYSSLGNQEAGDYLTGGGGNGNGTPTTQSMGTSGKGKQINWDRLNPVSHWRVGRTRINDFAFSPDFQHVAMIAEDGILRIMDLATEKLLETFDSFFGPLTCLAWSPDGRFLVTGGQDDLVTLYAPREGRVVARCQGHSSFVTGVAFDPWRWGDRTYRFGSVGEDLKLVLWDFSSASLGRPKHSAGPHHTGRRGSNFALASTPSLVDRYGSPPTRRSSGFDRPMPTHTNSNSTAHQADPSCPNQDEEAISHPAPPRSEVPLLQPVLVHQIETPGRDKEFLSGIRFNPNGLNVLYRSGAVDSWTRPSSEPQTQIQSKAVETDGINVPNGASISRKKTVQGSRFGSLGLGKGVTA